MFLIEVLAAIHFDNKFSAWSAKVNDIRPNSMLSAKAEASQAMAAQARPQPGFGFCGVAAEFFSP